MLFQIDPRRSSTRLPNWKLRWRRSPAGRNPESELSAGQRDVIGFTAQTSFDAKRLADIEGLASDDANTQFQAQDRRMRTRRCWRN